MLSSTSKTPVTIPHQTIRGHTDRVTGVVHLPGGRRILTCSVDGSLRLWDLGSGAQIGEDWRDESKVGVWSMALSPNDKTVASGSNDGTVRLWDVETRKVIAKWTRHTGVVWSLCWSADGKRVASGSWDGTARVWDVESGKTVLTIKTGHTPYVYAVIYSPDNKKIATGGYNESAVNIWDSKTGGLITTLKHDGIVWSLAWTSDGKKFITASLGPIRIFDTATWQQIAVLEGHTHRVDAISLSPNNSLLASVSGDKTVRLWNVDKNIPIGPPLQHEKDLESAALSADGKVLVTGGKNGNAYAWDIHAILKEAGLRDLLSTGTNIAPKNSLEQKASQGNAGTERTPRSSLSVKSFLDADATQCHHEFGGHVGQLPPRFFDGMEAEVHSSQTDSAHPHSSASALLARLSSLLHRFRHDNTEATERPQPSTPSGLHPQVLLARLSSLVRRSPPENDAANEPQRPSMPSWLDPHALLARLSSLLPRSQLNTEEETEPHPTTPGSRPDALIGRLYSLFRSRPHTNEEMELPQRPWRPHVVEVAPMRDRDVLFVAQRSPPGRPHTQPSGDTIPGARPAHSLPLRMLAHLVLFLCCASPQHDGNAQPTQQQQQGPSQTQAPSLQTQPAPSTSTTPIALDTCTTPAGAAGAQPRPLPWRARFVLFLCCASPPHTDGH